MKKLNKTQQWELAKGIITDNMAQAIKAYEADSGDIETGIATATELLLAKLADILAPATGGGTSTKINEEGDVYCNYFETYLAADRFNMKRAKNGEQVYKANSILAEQILRKVKNNKNKAITMGTEAFRQKLIKAKEFADICDRADSIASVKYEKVMEVPEVADIVGLTDTVSE